MLNSNGSSNVSIIANDGTFTTTQSFTATFSAVNDSPVISAIIAQSTNEDTAKVISFTITDVDSALTCTGSVVAATSNATIVPVSNVVFSGTAPNCTATVTPVGDANGAVNLTFTVSDTLITANSGFTLTVSSVNDAPVISAIAPQSTNEDTASIVNFTISDIDSALTCVGSVTAATANAAIVPVSNVVFSGTAPNCTATITPVADANGTVNLTFTVSDTLLSSSSSFNLNVNPVNDVPVISAIGAQSTNEDTVKLVNFTISDLDSTLTCAGSVSVSSSDTLVVPISNVVFSGTAPNCTATITPLADTNGSLVLTFTVSDTLLTANSAFNLSVSASNDAPVISVIASQITNEDTPFVLNFTINDVDSALNCVGSVTAATTNAGIVPVSNVVFSGTAPNCTATITPVGDANGVLNLTFTVSDTLLTANSAFALTVSPVNDAPVISVISAQAISEDAVNVVNFTVSDLDSTLTCGASISMSTSNPAIVPVTNVVFSGTAPNCTATITPVTNANGVVNLSLTVSDSLLTSSSPFTLTVSAVNDAPVMSAIAAQTTPENVNLAVNFTISDVDSVLLCSAANLSATSSNAGLIPVANIVFSGTLPNCTATLNPIASTNGAANISFAVDDGGTPNLQDAKSFLFTVTPFNDPPILSAIGAQSTNEDTVKLINFNISDVDNVLDCSTSMSVTSSNTAIVPVANVVFGGILPNCTATITPAADANGSVNLTITVSDSGVPIKTDFEIVTLTVNPINDAPVLNTIGVQSTNEDVTKVINFTISDVDSVLNCGTSNLAATSNGALVPLANIVFGGTFPNCTATVTPTPDANGVVNLTFTTSDGSLSDFETFAFTINPVNDAPILNSIGAQSTNEDVVKVINFTMSDIDSVLDCSASMSAGTSNSAIVPVANIVFGGAMPNCTATVTPVADANGTVNLTFTVSDGALTDFETFAFTVNAVNDAPVLNAIGAQSTSEDTLKVINFTISDIDSVLSCTTAISAGTSNAALVPLANISFGGTFPNCTATVTPVADANGVVSLTFTLSDGALTDFETFLFTVNAVNDAPILNAIGAQSTNEDTVKVINFTISDIDSALDCTTSMSVATSNSAIVPLANIVFAGALPNCSATVTPVADANGTVNLTFTLSDGALTDFEAVALTVIPVNDAPILNAIGAQSTNEDTVKVINFTISDIDSVLDCATSMSASTSNALLVPLSNIVFGGTLPNCTMTVTPVADANGTVNLTVTTSDGALTDFETFLFTVAAVNDAPVLGAIGSQSTNEDTAKVINFTISDIDSALNCTTSLSAATSNAAIVPLANIVFAGTFPNCTATITPLSDMNGTLNLTFTLSDGALTNSEIFVFTVNAVNDAPVLNPIGSQSTSEDSFATINFTISDVDNTLNCTTSMSKATSNSSIVPVANIVFGGTAPNCTVTVTPLADANGVVNLSFTVSDGVLTDFETILFTVNPVNDAPILGSIGAQTTAENVALAVNFTVNDVDSVILCSLANLTATSSNAGLIPTANIVFSGTTPNCTATFTPVASQNGTSNISITVDDGGTPNLQDAENFVLTVTPYNDPPILGLIGAQSVNEDGVATINFTISDIDNVLDCTTSLSKATSNSVIVPLANIVFSGTLPNCVATITPLADANGAVNLTLTVSDTGTPVKSDFESFTLTVNAVNDAPILNPIGAKTTTEDVAKVINFTISDVDNVLDCTTSMSVGTSNSSIVAVAGVVFGGALPNCTATVTPVANANGAVNLTFTVSDTALTDFESIVFTVNASNDAPVLGSVGAQSTNEDTAKVINFTISDVDSALNCSTSMSGGTSNAAIVPLANIVFGGTLPNCTATVTPIADANGSVNLTFTVSDGTLTAFETFVLTIAPINDAPILNSIGAQTSTEDIVKVINFTISDIDSTLACATAMSATSANSAILPQANIVFAGTFPNCTATLTTLADATGGVNLTFTVSDGALTNFETFLLTVSPVNDSPVLSSIGAQSSVEDNVKVINFTISDVDSVLNCTSSMSAATSNASIVPIANIVFAGTAPNCTATVTSVADTNGSVNLTFTVSDGTLTAFETFAFVITPVNDAPTMSPIGAQSTNEDTAKVVSFSITDIDSTLNCTTSLTAATSNAALVPIANIVFAGTAPNCTATVTPLADVSGVVNLTFTASDGALTDFKTFALTINAINDAPILNTIGAQSINEDSVTVINFTISDIDSTLNCVTSMSAGTSNAAIVTMPGIVFGGTFPNCTATVTTVADANGSVNLTFTLSDGALTDFETFSLTVNPVNDAPVLSAIGNQSTNEDVAKAISFTVSDIDSTLNCATSMSAATSNSTIVSVANVVFGGTFPNCTATVTPVTNANGSVNLTFTLSDGALTDFETFALTVSPVNDGPVLGSIGAQSTNEDTAKAISFTITDIDSTLNCTTSLTAATSNAALVPVANIVFTGTAPNCTATVTPLADVNGSLNLTFTVSDGSLTAFETFALTITAVNDAPVISVTSVAPYTVNEDNSMVINFTINDIDSTVSCTTSMSGNTSTPALVAVSGIVFGGTFPNCTATISPLADQNGASNLVFRVTDSGALFADTAALTVTVNAVNDAPTISSIADLTVNEDNSTGAIAFTIADIDNVLICSSANVTAVSSNTALVPNASLIIGGTFPNCTITATPTANANGTTTITVTVNDNGTPNLQAIETYLLTVSAINDAPTISSISNQTINEDSPSGSLAFTITDLETGGALTCAGSVVGTSSNQTLIANAGIVVSGTAPNCNVVVTPGLDQSGGPVTITLTVTDTGTPMPAATATTTFTVSITNVNDAPILGAIGAQSTNEDTVKVINFTIFDVDSVLDCTTSMGIATSDATKVTTGGVVFTGTYPNCIATITPVLNANGNVDLTFTLSDGSLTDSETFTLTLNPVNDAPTISTIANLTTANGTAKWEDNNPSAPQDPAAVVTAFTINFTINDTDSTLLCNSTYLSTASTNAAVIPATSISFSGTYPNCVASVTLNANANTTDHGAVSLTFTVTDTSSSTSGNSFVVEVKPRNDNPTIAAIADQFLNMNSAIVVNYTVSDSADASSLINCTTRITVISDNTTLLPSANVVRTGTVPNCVLTITPVVGQVGTANLSVRVSDGAAGSSPFEDLAINVNSPPTITDLPPTSFPSGNPTPVNFTIGDLESALSCTSAVTAASSNTAVIPVGNIVFSGGSSTPSGTVVCTATITAISTGTSNLTFTATDGAANTANNASTMTSLSAGAVVVSQSLSTVSVTANSSIASSRAYTQINESVSITITARDTSNNILGGGHWVVIQRGSGTSNGTLSAVTDNNDGTYTALFTGNTTGTARTFNAYIDGYPITSTLPTVTVSNYGPNCLSYKNVGNITDGTYALDPDGDVGAAAPYFAFCDMNTNGGGWTLAAVPRKGIAPFGETSGLLSPLVSSASRNSNIWHAGSSFEFSQLRVTSDSVATQYSIANFNASKSVAVLLATYSTYSQSNVAVGANNVNAFVTSNIASTCFIVRGKSLSIAGWNDSADYLFMGFHGGSGCSVPLSLANNWDRVNVSQQWLISGYDGLDSAQGPEETNSNVGQNFSGTDWVNLDSPTIIWLR